MKRLADQTLYEILEVPPDATPTAIAEAVERARELYGPGSLATYTLMSTEEATLLARRIDEAQQTLLDPAARSRYDEALEGPGEARAVAHAGGGSAHAGATTSATPWSIPPVIPAVLPPAAERDASPEEGDRAEPVAAAEPAPAAPAEAVVIEPGRTEAVRTDAMRTEAMGTEAMRTEATAGGAVAVGPARAEPVAVEPPPTPPAGEVAPAPAAAAPATPRAAPERPAPILLSREVIAPPARPTEPLPLLSPVAPVPGASAPTPGPIFTPVPMIPPPAPAPTPAVPDGTAWTGEVLRKLREARGITVQQIAERTKVTRHHIENIEADRYAQLPAAVYLRGILLSIARELRLDGQKVARSYLERVAAAAGGGAPRR